MEFFNQEETNGAEYGVGYEQGIDEYLDDDQADAGSDDSTAAQGGDIYGEETVYADGAEAENYPPGDGYGEEMGNNAPPNRYAGGNRPPTGRFPGNRGQGGRPHLNRRPPGPPYGGGPQDGGGYRNEAGNYMGGAEAENIPPGDGYVEEMGNNAPPNRYPGGNRPPTGRFPGNRGQGGRPHLNRRPPVPPYGGGPQDGGGYRNEGGNRMGGAEAENYPPGDGYGEEMGNNAPPNRFAPPNKFAGGNHPPGGRFPGNMVQGVRPQFKPRQPVSPRPQAVPNQRPIPPRPLSRFGTHNPAEARRQSIPPRAASVAPVQNNSKFTANDILPLLQEGLTALNEEWGRLEQEDESVEKELSELEAAMPLELKELEELTLACGNLDIDLGDSARADELEQTYTEIEVLTETFDKAFEEMEEILDCLRGTNGALRDVLKGRESLLEDSEKECEELSQQVKIVLENIAAKAKKDVGC